MSKNSLPLLLTFPVFIQAAGIYVELNGSDQSGNGTQANPFRTISKAITALPNGTNEVLVGAGTFREGTTIWIPSNTTLQGSGKGATTLQGDASPILRTEGTTDIRISSLTLDGRNRSTERALQAKDVDRIEVADFTMNGFTSALQFYNATGVRVHDFDGTNPAYCTAAAIELQVNVDDAQIFNGNVVQDDNTPGKLVGAGPDQSLNPTQPWTLPKAKISNVSVYDNVHQTPARGCWAASPGNYPPGFSLELWHVDLSNIEVYNNHVRSGFSIQSNGTDYAADRKTIHIHHNLFDLRDEYRFALEVSTHNMEIDHNQFSGGTYPICSFESGVGGAVKNLRVTHNVFENQVISNLLMNISTGVSNALFAHNTVYVTSGNAMFSIGGTTDMRTINNIFEGSSNWNNAAVGGALRNNLYYRITSQGTNVLTANPMWVGTGAKPSPWYTLQSNSPAIDAGEVIADLTQETIGTAPDIGAFESGVVAWSVGPGAFVSSSSSSNVQSSSSSASISSSSAVRELIAPVYEADSSIFLQPEGADSLHGIDAKLTVVGSCDMGDYILYKSLDLGEGVDIVQMSTAVDAMHADQSIQVRVDSTSGTQLGSFSPKSGGGWGDFVTASNSLQNQVYGVHDVYFVMAATAQDQAGVADIDWIRLYKRQRTTPVDIVRMPFSTHKSFPRYLLNGQRTEKAID